MHPLLVTPNLKIISRSGYVPSPEIIALSLFFFFLTFGIKANGLRALQSIAYDSIGGRFFLIHAGFSWLTLSAEVGAELPDVNSVYSFPDSMKQSFDTCVYLRKEFPRFLKKLSLYLR